MYYEYWGLNRQAFDNVPDPTMYFRAHESVETAVAEVLFAIEEGDECLAVIVGEVGLGKTTSMRVILDTLDQEKYRIAFVTNPDVTFTMLLREIIGQLIGHTCEVKRKDDLLEEFNRLLFETADQGKRVLIFIDEGNAFKPANLESLRLLTNMQMDDRNLFTIVLAGQPKLAKMLEAPSRANLFQRIGVYCRLERMASWEVVRDYIDHRLERAGATRRIFTDDAIKALYKCSEKGVPRLVNKLAKLSLKAGETHGSAEISADMINGIGERFVRFTTRGKDPAKTEDAPEPAKDSAPAAEPQEVTSEPVETMTPEPVEVVSETPVHEFVQHFEPEGVPEQSEEVFDDAAPAVTHDEGMGRYGRVDSGEIDVWRQDAPRGGDSNSVTLSFTQVCLDEVLRPDVLERVRGANRVEQVKMAGQLAAEEIKKHPEAVSQAGDPVVMWKELRNEILSAFTAERSS